MAWQLGKATLPPLEAFYSTKILLWKHLFPPACVELFSLHFPYMLLSIGHPPLLTENGIRADTISLPPPDFTWAFLPASSQVTLMPFLLIQ